MDSRASGKGLGSGLIKSFLPRIARSFSGRQSMKEENVR